MTRHNVKPRLGRRRQSQIAKSQPDILLTDALIILRRDIDRLNKKGSLAVQDSKLLQSHMRVLLEATKEKRIAEAKAAEEAKKAQIEDLESALVEMIETNPDFKERVAKLLLKSEKKK